MRIASILALVFAACGFSQPAQVQVNADCVIAFTITAQNGTGPSSGSYDNRQVGCNSWQMQYGSTGFSAVSLTLQSSTDNSTWATMSGTAVFGTNPLTSTTGASLLWQAYGTNFPPYVRVIASTATGTGTLTGILLGYRAAGIAGSSGGGGLTSNINVQQIDGSNTPATSPTGTMPLAMYNGSSWQGLFACTNQALFNLSGSGNTRIISASATGTVRICSISFATAAAEDIKLTEGTGTNCGTGTADLTGLYKSITTAAFDQSNTAAWLTQTSGDDVCLNQSVAQALGGIVVYAKY